MMPLRICRSRSSSGGDSRLGPSMEVFSLAAARAAAQGIGFRFQITGAQLIAGCLANLGQAIQRRDQRVAIRAEAEDLFEGPLSRGIVAQAVRALGQAKPGVDAA